MTVRASAPHSVEGMLSISGHANVVLSTQDCQTDVVPRYHFQCPERRGPTTPFTRFVGDFGANQVTAGVYGAA